ncbi:MAG: TrmH family RNA methyltransferase [Anaerotardibacter sp.]
MIEHVNADDSRLTLYSGLTDAQLRECYTQKAGNKLGLYSEYSNGLFIAESKNVIARALKGGYQVVSLFLEEKWLTHEMPLIEEVLAKDPEIPVMVVNHEDFRAVTGYQVTRGALAAFQRKPLLSIEELCKDAHRIVILEDITNFTNIGALFRSAAALGIDAVLITPNCHDPLYRRASRVSMGAVFQVPWTRIEKKESWVEDAAPTLRALGFKMAAMALVEDSLSVEDEQLAQCEKLAIVLGTEGDGLKPSTIDACDYTVMIPMEHEVDSLNVAAAGAVAFWELRYKKGRR